MGIALNSFAFWRNCRGQPLNAKMVNWHFLEDLLGCTVFLLESIAMYFGEYLWLDPLMALGVTLSKFYGIS